MVNNELTIAGQAEWAYTPRGTFEREGTTSPETTCDRGNMSDETEKSCWGVTLWVVAVVVTLMVVTTLFNTSKQTAGTDAISGADTVAASFN